MCINQPMIVVPCAKYLRRTRTIAKFLEDREAARSGQKLAVAREAVARRANVSPGTLFNLRANRLKEVGGHIGETLRRLLIAELRKEVRRHERKIAILELAGGASAELDLVKIKAKLAEIEEAIGGVA